MPEQPKAVCAICGNTGPGDPRWFLLVQNYWQDKLKVLHWNHELAWQPAVSHACSSAHVRELVVHWMITARLDHPFARTSANSPAPHKVPKVLRPLQRVSPDLSQARQIGELAIHRESMERALCDNPQALAGILDALVVAMTQSEPQEGHAVAHDAELWEVHMEV